MERKKVRKQRNVGKKEMQERKKKGRKERKEEKVGKNEREKEREIGKGFVTSGHCWRLFVKALFVAQDDHKIDQLN